MVFRRTKRSRSTFRRLPFGASYWPSSNLTGAPVMKISRTTTAGALASNTITGTTVSDITIAVTRTPLPLARPNTR